VRIASCERLEREVYKPLRLSIPNSSQNPSIMKALSQLTLFLALSTLSLATFNLDLPPIVKTSSGILRGVREDGGNKKVIQRLHSLFGLILFV